MTTTVLIVDDNRSAADALALVLRRSGYRAESLYDGAAALERLAAGGIDVVLTDLKMEPVDGMSVLRGARELSPPPEVLVFTGYGSVATAVEAMHLGARDFLTKPVTPTQLLERLQALADPSAEAASEWSGRLGRQLELLAGVSSTVLLRGEPGSGRGSAAARIHARSARGERPLVSIAHPSRIDADTLAAAGTAYVPQVDRLPPEEAATLGRVLDALPRPEEGGPRVVASALPTWSAHAGGPLYYQLAVLVLDIPPLRERVEDLPALFERILAERSQALGRTAPRPTPAQLERLQAHHWPGNLREAAAVCERATVFGGEAFDLADQPGRTPADLEQGFSLSRYLEDEERRLLEQAIRQTGGNRTAMSRLLGVERNTLRYKLNKHDLLE